MQEGGIFEKWKNCRDSYMYTPCTIDEYSPLLSPGGLTNGKQPGPGFLWWKFSGLSESELCFWFLVHSMCFLISFTCNWCGTTLSCSSYQNSNSLWRCFSSVFVTNLLKAFWTNKKTFYRGTGLVISGKVCFMIILLHMYVCFTTLIYSTLCYIQCYVIVFCTMLYLPARYFHFSKLCLRSCIKKTWLFTHFHFLGLGN